MQQHFNELAAERGMERLFRPASIAVIGGGAWCESVIRRCREMGFAGPIWPVHPKRAEMGGEPALARISELPDVPDAVFIGVNRYLTIEAVAELSAMGAGGAVCFASGFQEAEAELSDGADLQRQLLEAAGEMPILGPNCYGFINYLDGALLWPDQHGGARVESGVAILTQSSNIALNLTMQRRGLPLAYLVTVGNQAQSGLAEIGAALLADDRVSALGLHIEGVGDLRALEALAAEARAHGKRIVAVKAGKSEQARAATISHTASLAGSDAGARALLERLGIGQVESLAELLEALKILHVAGSLPSNRIASMSCSGGEASLMADAAEGLELQFPRLNEAQEQDLREALGPKVALANPLDYHTYIWGDQQALANCFSAMMDPSLALGIVVLDFPRADRCSAAEWDAVIEAAAEAQEAKGVQMAILASLPENLPEKVATRLIARGVIPLSGMSEALAALQVCARPLPDVTVPLLIPGAAIETRTWSEAEAKSALSADGLRVPGSARAWSARGARETAEKIGFPVVLKGEGLAHKSEAGAVRLNLMSGAEVEEAALSMPCDSFLVEEMIAGGVAELLVGVVRDPAHGFVLTIAAGGVLTELLTDSVSLLLPVDESQLDRAVSSLKINRILNGYRGAPAADRSKILAAIMAVQSYVMDHADDLEEVEINPLIATPTDAIAADALIKGK